MKQNHKPIEKIAGNVKPVLHSSIRSRGGCQVTPFFESDPAEKANYSSLKNSRTFEE